MSLDGCEYASLQSHRTAITHVLGRGVSVALLHPGLSARSPRAAFSGARTRAEEPSGWSRSARGTLGLPCTPQGHPRGQHVRGDRLQYGGVSPSEGYAPRRRHVVRHSRIAIGPQYIADSAVRAQSAFSLKVRFSPYGDDLR